jgi:hypothetical protein
MHHTIIGLEFHYNSNEIKLINESQLQDAYSKMIPFGILPQFNSQAPSDSNDKGFEFKSQNGDKLLIPLPDRLLLKYSPNVKVTIDELSLEQYINEAVQIIQTYQDICGDFSSNRLSIICQMVTYNPTGELYTKLHSFQTGYPWKETATDRVSFTTLDEISICDETANLKVSIETGVMEKHLNSAVIKEKVLISILDVNTLDDKREYRFDVSKAAQVWKEQTLKITTTINQIQTMATE